MDDIDLQIANIIDKLIDVFYIARVFLLNSFTHYRRIFSVNMLQCYKISRSQCRFSPGTHLQRDKTLLRSVSIPHAEIISMPYDILKYPELYCRHSLFQSQKRYFIK